MRRDRIFTEVCPLAARVAPAENRPQPLISGRYRILEELGRGGMGAVYRARDETTGSTIALKTLEHSDVRLTGLFEREYHTLASLKHPRVIEVYDFGITEQGRRFYTMELLAGDDLLSLSPLPYRAACAHLRDVATSLALLHARRLLHRDVSPRNVRLDSQGRAKLIDFGALGNFGLAREIVGTPPCMAPEAVQRLPLDQRSDLFSLGATLYFALTKTVPFAIRRIEDVEGAHRTAPVAPSKLVPDVPVALDQLVLSLLSLDPMERPSSAAEVMDRLAAIADLDAEPLTGLAESHLLSSALIGREREKGQLNQHVARALRGAGSVVIIDGASGMGRTRLASELSIDARIAGVTTLRVDALAHQEPSGTLRALARGLLEVTPVEAQATLPKHVSVLGQAFDELKARARPSGASSPLPKEPTERKALIQRTFLAWLLDVCAQRPLVLVIDDAHAVDADSAGALVLIAHAAPRARLLLAVTEERDALAPAAIRQLTRVAARIRLRSLDGEDIDKLITSVFGDVPHRSRLAAWLVSAGRGNPGQSLELLKHLVDRGIIRYGGGAWALPAELPEEQLPKGLEEALLARMATLGPEAHRLARLFALYRGALPLRVCLKLAPEHSDAQIVGALDRLVASEILVRADDAYRFGREATRARLLAGLTPAELLTLHAALARAFFETRPELFEAIAQRKQSTLSTADLGLALQVASHIERGGEEERGRILMREAAVELTVRGDGLAEAVPALENAIAVLRQQGRPPYELLPLLVPLTLAGTYTDFRLSYRYGDETLNQLLDIAGLTWAAKARRYLGPRLALWVGLAGGFLRFQLTDRSSSTAGFRDVMLGVMGIGTALLGTFSVLVDKERARGVAARLEMLGYFPEGHPVRWVHMLQLALLDTTLGNAAGSCDKAMRVFEALSAPGGVPGVREEARLQLAVGCLTPVSLGYGQRVDGKVHAVFEALDQMHMSVSRQIAAGARATYYGHRGERSKFIAYHEETDMLASQAGSTWREDIGTPRQMWSTYALCEDVMGLKRAAHDLDKLAEELPSIRDLRDAARACYLCERGMPGQALAEYRAMFERTIREPQLQGTRFAGAYARILRVAGEPQRAKEVCEEALGRLAPENRAFKMAVFGAQLELLLATAALGQLEQAAEALDALIDEQAAHDNPLLHGLAHKARAEVALAQRDRQCLRRHLNEMDSWFRRSDNPALVAQCQRLFKEGRLAGVLDSDRPSEGGAGPMPREIAQVSVAFHACRGPAERLQVAIDLVVGKAGAERGYLYLLEPSGLRFAAPLVGSEPPEGLLKDLGARIERLREDPLRTRPEGTFETTVYDDDPQFGSQSATDYVSLLLTFPRERELVVVGAIAMVPPSEVPLAKIDPSYLESIARAIYGAGDVRSVYFDAPDSLATMRARPAPANENV
jgi:tRNA A-37 threonylcarbamoyl transferase component Bud32